jgi:hypothetical protein
MGTRQDNSLPLFLLRSDLFFCTSSSLFSPTCPRLRYGTGRRHRQASSGAWRSASGPLRVIPPMIPPGALYHRILGASQISVGTSPRHPAAGNNCHTGTQHLGQIDYSRVMISYLHPLLGPVHCLQVTRHCHRVDEIIRQKLDPTTTSRGGPGHRRRTDRLRN